MAPTASAICSVAEFHSDRVYEPHFCLYDLDFCPWRQRAGIPIGRLSADAAAPRGVMVGGVPMGTPQYVQAVLTAEVVRL